MIVLDYYSSEAKVSLRLGVIAPNINDEVLKAISEIVQELQAYIISEKLSGQVLKRRSGKLIKGIKRRVFTGRRGLYGIITSTAPYGMAHEFGLKKTEQVKASFRSTKSGRKANVRAHSRKVDYPKHAYLRPSLKEMKGSIQERLEEAITRGVAKE